MIFSDASVEAMLVPDARSKDGGGRLIKVGRCLSGSRDLVSPELIEIVIFYRFVTSLDDRFREVEWPG